jgi:hypothetical protein
MQTSSTPALVCDEAEKICRDFIWGSTSQHCKWASNFFGEIYHPKEEGGMGFRSLCMLNKSFTLKLAWQMVAESDKL